EPCTELPEQKVLSFVSHPRLGDKQRGIVFELLKHDFQTAENALHQTHSRVKRVYWALRIYFLRLLKG
ncbi:unnamed protein product, partial [Orchesella dallaii]